jgi:hypothetical protein
MDLMSWFRQVVGSLLTYGEVFYSVGFGDWIDGRPEIYPPKWLPPETMSPVREGSNVVGFRQEYSDDLDRSELRGKRIEFERSEVLHLRWPECLMQCSHVPPVASVVRDVAAAEAAFQLQSDIITARTEVSIGAADGWQSERIAVMDPAAKRREFDERRAIIARKLGVPLSMANVDLPYTEYFATLEFARFGKRLAVLREYLVGEFNSQVLAHWGRRVGTSNPPLLRLDGYCSSEEWALVETTAEDGNANQEAVWQLLRGIR